MDYGNHYPNNPENGEPPEGKLIVRCDLCEAESWGEDAQVIYGWERGNNEYCLQCVSFIDEREAETKRIKGRINIGSLRALVASIEGKDSQAVAIEVEEWLDCVDIELQEEG